MIDHLIIALLLLAIAGVLIFLGVPKKVDNIRAYCNSTPRWFCIRSLSLSRNGCHRSDYGVARNITLDRLAMSVLGQKQTCAVQNSMSALPPKADKALRLANR